MRYKQFALRLVNLIVILLLLVVYQSVMHIHAQEETIAQLEAERDQLEADQAYLESGGSLSDSPGTNADVDAEADANAEVDAEAEGNASADTAAVYTDGVYAGTAEGFGGPIAVSVEIESGAIAGVEIVSASGEDAAYLSLAQDVIDDILAQQTADVDSISGATYSSEGIKGAVKEALLAASDQEGGAQK